MKSKFNLLRDFLDIELHNYSFRENLCYLVGSIPSLIKDIKTPLHKIPNPSGLLLIKKLMLNNTPSKPFNLKRTDFYFCTSSLGNTKYSFLHSIVSCFTPDIAIPKNQFWERKEELLSSFHIIYPD